MRRSNALIAAAVLLSLTACGTAASRVAVERDQTDIVFGFTTPKPAARATAGPAEAPGPRDDEVRPFTPAPISTFAPSSAAPECPTAEPNQPISGSSGNAVRGRPKAGAYRWNGTGSFVVQNTNLPVPSPVQRYLRNVKDFDDSSFSSGDSGDTFTYETIERQVSASQSGNWLFHWQVKTDSTGSDPEGGLVLKRIDFLTPEGKYADTYFEPISAGLLIVPFPIKAGATWNTTSVDLGNSRTYQLSGQVLSREAVDVCGEFVQGWHVHAELSGSGDDATLDYVVSPEHGGQVISWTVDGIYLGTTFAKANYHAGTLDPDPLPEDYRS